MLVKQSRFIVSASEIESFEQCHRQWRMAREYEPTVPSPKFWFGTGIHVALEAYYNARMDDPAPLVWEDAAIEAYSRWFCNEEHTLHQTFGPLWEDAQEAYISLFYEGKQVLTNYAAYDVEAATSFTPLIVERRLYAQLPGTNTYITFKMDLVASCDESPLVIVDHKTASTAANSGRSLDINEQGTAYVWGLWRTTGKVADFAHNTLFKVVPVAPTVLKGGGLSKAKDQITTHEKYLDAIYSRDLNPASYRDILDHLKSKGWDRFFKREISYRTEDQLRNFEERAIIITEEMRRCIKEERYAYPAPSGIKCPNCHFLNPCSLKESGYDFAAHLEQNYTRNAGNLLATPMRIKREKNDTAS